MEKRDARCLAPEAQEEVRRQAVKLLKQGKTQAEVAVMLEVSRAAVNGWWKRHREGGSVALKPRKRGRKRGYGILLSPEQEKEIRKLICDHTPDQLKMKFALWSRDAVKLLIEERYGISYTLQGLGVVLKRWGFTPQRPIKRAYEQNATAVKQWMQQDYPQVKAKAKAENAEIWWGDETAVKPECHYRRGFSPKGKTPVVRQPAKRFHSSMISAINNQGKIQWMTLNDALNAQTFIRFLQQLIKWRKRKIVLIVDNLRVHHSKIVKEWLEGHKDRIELVYLPSYSPELNPDEYLNNHLKQTITRTGPPASKTALDLELWSNMISLQNKLDLIASFFRHPNVRYAA